MCKRAEDAEWIKQRLERLLLTLNAYIKDCVT